MPELSRRAFLRDAAGAGAALLLAGCVGTPESGQPVAVLPQMPFFGGSEPDYALMYAPIYGERFPIPGIDLATIDPAFLRREVPYLTADAPGTIVIDPAAHYLYYVLPGG